jgi:replicative DNA helicase
MAKSLPHHQEAEQRVLGTVFLEPKRIRSVADQLQKEDFFEAAHQHIFEAMLYLDQEKLSIDYVSVASRLETKNQLKSSGGLPYLYQLSEAVPSSTHLDTYIELVKESRLKRDIIDFASKVLEEGYEGNMDVSNYVDYAETGIFSISQRRRTSGFQTLSEVAENVKSIAERNAHKQGITGLKTGFKNLDDLTAGLQPEELIILAARPSMGKSAFAMNLAINVAKRNKEGHANVAIFSLEMSNDQLVARMLSSEGNIKNSKIKAGNLTSKEWQFLETGIQTLKRLNIFFDDSGTVTVQDIRAKCRKLAQEDKLDFVVIDYLQLIKSESKTGNRQEEVAQISRSLKQMARELKVPVLALSQLSREVDKRDDKQPVLADLRESGSIEQDADIVMFLYRKDYYVKQEDQKTGEVDLSIAKNRQGIAGVKRMFRFDTEYSRFTALEDRDEDYISKD